METIGNTLKKMRTLNKLRLKDVADIADLSISYISDIENNRKNPSIRTLKKLASVYGVSISKILECETNP